MKPYVKPSIVGNESIGGIIPLGAIAGLSAAKLAVIGVAALAGAAVGAAVARKGNNIIITEFTNALTARKDFGLV